MHLHDTNKLYGSIRITHLKQIADIFGGMNKIRPQIQSALEQSPHIFSTELIESMDSNRINTVIIIIIII